MIKRKDYKYLNNPDYSLSGERFFKNAQDFLSSNTVVNAVYLSSNEQLDIYFPMMNLEGKKVATVGSSGDQVLNALFYGSKDVTLIDANVLSQAFIEYKMALIKTLSFEEFLYVMFNDRSLFEWRVYSKISHLLSNETKALFDPIMLMQEEVNYDSYLDYDKFSDLKIFTGVVNNLPHTEFSEFYHSPEAYYRLQNILINQDFKLKFIVSRLEDFAERLPEKYDFISLSNIYDYVPRFKFNIALKKLYNKKLNDGGTIQFQYLFEDSILWKKRPKEMKGYEFEVIQLHAQEMPPSQKDRDNCKVYLLKKPNSKELELG